MANYIKAFIIPYEAWYKNVVIGDPCIYIGLYSETGGARGEFQIVWDNIGIQLQAYNDSWETLGEMPELIGLMKEICIQETEPTVQEFARLLKDINFKDITERERP